MEQTSPRKACDTAEDHCTLNGDTFNENDVLQIVNNDLTITTTPTSDTMVPAGTNIVTSVTTDPHVNENHPPNMEIDPIMNGLLDSVQNTDVETALEPERSFSTRFSSEKMIATPNPLSEMENNDGNIDNVNSDLFRAGEEMPSIDDFTDNDIQELCNLILPGYQTDAIPFSPEIRNMNRCKSLIIILTSYQTSCNNII